MGRNSLLETYLRQLRLPTFAKNYAPMATDAARNNQDHIRFLLALAELDVNQREQNRLQLRIKTARFPVMKELADFDFSALPSLNKAHIWLYYYIDSNLPAFYTMVYVSRYDPAGIFI
jgi:DNA replication protein DnaC